MLFMKGEAVASVSWCVTATVGELSLSLPRLRKITQANTHTHALSGLSLTLMRQVVCCVQGVHTFSCVYPRIKFILIT